MGQVKDFGMSFSQGGMSTLLSQTSSDLQESLTTTNTALEVADGKVANLRVRLEEVDHCVMGLEGTDDSNEDDSEEEFKEEGDGGEDRSGYDSGDESDNSGNGGGRGDGGDDSGYDDDKGGNGKGDGHGNGRGGRVPSRVSISIV
eukprot:XP_020397224.1 cell wall protein IFF6-like [Zea mays]